MATTAQNGQGKPTRVASERTHLTCSTCGAGNRLAPEVVERGFQCCSHCTAAMPVEGAGSYAIQNTTGGFTRVVSPGRSQFVLLLGRVLSLPAFVLFLVLGNLPMQALRHLLLSLGAPHALAWVPVGLFALAAVVAFVLLCVEQRILVMQNRIEITSRAFGIKIRHRRFGTHGVTLEPRGGWWKGLWLRPRSGRPVLVRTEGDAEAEVLRDELAEAMEEARVPVAPGALPCPGCGAPATTPMALIEKGGVECPHCGSGLVATKGGVVLGDVTLRLARAPLASPPRVRRRGLAHGAVEWLLRPELFARPGTALLLMLTGLGCGGLLAALGVVVLIKSAPWYGFGAIFALALVPMGVLFLGCMLVSALGSHRVRLDAGVLEHEVWLGPLRASHRVVPLARLLALSVDVNVGGVKAAMRTALGESSFELPGLNGEGAVVSEELLDGLAERLRAMGRGVEVKRANAAPAPAPGGGREQAAEARRPLGSCSLTSRDPALPPCARPRRGDAH